MNNDGITDLVDYDEDYETSDNTISRSRFVIKVEVFDQTVFPVIQQSIMDYIESNNYIRELNSIRKRQLQALINKLADEISMLDSLKKFEYFKDQEQLTPQSGQILVTNEKDTQLYHGQIISLYRQRQDLEERLEIRTDPITIIQDFSALAVIENTLFTYLKKYGILGIVFGIFIAFIYEKWPIVRRVIRESQKQ